MGCTSLRGDKRHHRRADGVDDGGPGDQPNLPESRLHTRRNGAGGDRSRHPTEFAHISFRLRKGEILGFYGLVGAGRTELMQALSGVSRPSSGEIRLNGRTMRFHQPADAIRAGIVCVPEERQKQGAIIALPIAQNISLPQLSKLNPNGILNDAREWRLADEYASRLQVKAFSWRQPVETLSGGNQQKVVIGKWLATQPEVIILDEPTKGIDIGSKAAVHQFMSELVSQGWR